MAIDVRSLTGEEINTVLPALARLRMVVFHDWPYLYDGTLEYTSERAFAGLPASALPNPIESSAPPMRLAIERQFGLKLTKERAPIPVVVIDAVTRPVPD